MLKQIGEGENLPIIQRSVSQPEKKIRIYMEGCFDLMHSGHYNALRQAKQLGDILVAGVVSDENVLKNKGPPILNEKERAEWFRL